MSIVEETVPGMCVVVPNDAWWIEKDNILIPLDNLVALGLDNNYKVPIHDSLMLIRFRDIGTTPVRIHFYGKECCIQNMSMSEFALFAITFGLDISKVPRIL